MYAHQRASPAARALHPETEAEDLSRRRRLPPRGFTGHEEGEPCCTERIPDCEVRISGKTNRAAPFAIGAVMLLGCDSGAHALGSRVDYEIGEAAPYPPLKGSSVVTGGLACSCL